MDVEEWRDEKEDRAVEEEGGEGELNGLEAMELEGRVERETSQGGEAVDLGEKKLAEAPGGAVGSGGDEEENGGEREEEEGEQGR